MSTIFAFSAVSCSSDSDPVDETSSTTSSVVVDDTASTTIPLELPSSSVVDVDDEDISDGAEDMEMSSSVLDWCMSFEAVEEFEDGKLLISTIPDEMNLTDDQKAELVDAFDELSGLIASADEMDAAGIDLEDPDAVALLAEIEAVGAEHEDVLTAFEIEADVLCQTS